MEWTGLNELREKFLSFYESKGHTRLPSAPLIPKDEASLLIINSGMAPLKKYFTRQAFLPNGSFRATSCQKCIRTPDIENVGHTARHGTYFEMLGNFSFGDYFKEDATTWAWEFITEVLKIPKEKLYVTVYENDDEAFEIWNKHRGVEASHISRLGKDDNFWEIGAGPCGPCSEIYYDRGEEYGCGSPTCGPGCDCDRYMEFWNLVFTQFNADGEGNYTPLEHKNIDTGMGLERLACLMQGVDNLFEVDTVQNIMKHITKIAGVEYKKDAKTDVSIRVVTDHIRSTTFMVGDGILPSNEGRGYVLRRLLRRAARHGRLLGIKEPFLYKVAETVIGENANAYPELVENKDYIIKVIRLEEERFAKTIDAGLDQVARIFGDMEKSGSKTFPGEEAFKLYDTFGFPIDLTKEMCEEKGYTVDEETYHKLMEEQRNTAREATRTNIGDVAWVEDTLKGMEGGHTFVGYNTLKASAEILALVNEGERVDSISDGFQAQIVLSETPFYAESGGQVGDTGVITIGDSVFEVKDTQKSPSGHIIHIGQVRSGKFKVGDKVEASVDATRRATIMRNHTAAHLLQKALQETLGDHVHQAGQLVDEHAVRFDFTHFSAMTAEEIAKVEARVNELILEANPVNISEMPIEEAKKLGAMALFGEKYGNIVRVVNANNKSIEFCGGTHVDNTAKLGLFKILKESSVAAGVRRIEAVTGTGVLKYIEENESILKACSAELKVGTYKDLPAKTAQLAGDLKASEKKCESMEAKLADSKMNSLVSGAVAVKNVKVIANVLDATKPDQLRLMTDAAKEKNDDLVVVLATVFEGKGSIAVGCGKAAVAAGANAGKIVKALATLTGANGGGKPDSAMGGVGDTGKLADAIKKASEIIGEMV